MIRSFLPTLMAATVSLVIGLGNASPANAASCEVPVTIDNYMDKGSAFTFCGYHPKTDPTVTAFQGIQYALADRWKSPRRDTSQTSPFAATNWGPACPQTVNDSQFGGDVIIGQEDCLYLNIWVPQGADASTPIMFFIHGGAFIFGSAADGAWTIKSVDANKLADVTFDPEKGSYNGTRFAGNQGVILVSINYRLGALGFLYQEAAPYEKAAPDYGLADTVYGSLGIQDQTSAMKWVRENIDHFIGATGDPAQRITTLFGESAGAMSTGLHLFSGNGTSDLFDAVIMESNPMGVRYRHATPDGPAQKQGGTYLKNLCDKVGEDVCIPRTNWAFDTDKVPLYDIMFNHKTRSGFFAKTLQTLSKAKSFAGVGWNTLLPWSPIIGAANGKDDPSLSLLSHQPIDGYADPETMAKPVFWGTNRDEAVLFTNMLSEVERTTLFNPLVTPLLVDTMFKTGELGVFADKKLHTLTSQFIQSGDPSLPYCISTKDSEEEAACTPQFTAINQPQNALDNAGTNYAFHCSGFQAADAAKAQAPKMPVHSYVFSQSPVVQVFPVAKACNINAGADDLSAVCHAYELPFVFNTLDTAYDDDQLVKDITRGGDKWTQALDLAASMNATWASFAKDPMGFDPMAEQGDYVYALNGLDVGFGNQEAWYASKAAKGSPKEVWGCDSAIWNTIVSPRLASDPMAK
ncbi:carboxylesterase family protein [Magnetovibrio sp. PR-2]|uniref:carboxylesterase family protein n=1 Tax=Magnetovibrio sp. PR-2 TaxID=3120356 RepID=UPI002FCDF810